MPDKKEPDKKEPEIHSRDQPDWIDELYAEGRQELPPPALDARIQAAARSAPKRSWISPGRLTTLATAASLVLAAMVIYYAPETPPDAASEGLIREEALEKTDQAGRAGATMRISDSPETGPGFAAKETGPQVDMAADRPAAESLQPAAAPMELKKAERDQSPTAELAQTRTSEMRRNLPLDSAGVAMASVDADAAIRLAELCGPLPGTAETRSLSRDAVDWYLTVISPGTDRQYWRCQDGAWIELAEPVSDTPSDEQ